MRSSLWFTFSLQERRTSSRARRVNAQPACGPGHMLAQSSSSPSPCSSLRQPSPPSTEPGAAGTLDFNRPTNNAVLWLATLADKWANQKVFKQAKMPAWAESVSVKIVVSDIDWQYPNYSDCSQYPLGSCGREDVKLILAGATWSNPYFPVQSPWGLQTLVLASSCVDGCRSDEACQRSILSSTVRYLRLVSSAFF